MYCMLGSGVIQPWACDDPSEKAGIDSQKFWETEDAAPAWPADDSLLF